MQERGISFFLYGERQEKYEVCIKVIWFILCLPEDSVLSGCWCHGTLKHSNSEEALRKKFLVGEQANQQTAA
ncbi:hypothetical protein COE51_09990 [Bacillus pseudomycoides]|nr:hypothetical protein COE51_09990 [Bacillus pseudomycoides]